VIDLKEQKSYLAEVKKEVIAKGISKIYKDEELMNLTAFQVAKVYFNAIALNSLINLETKFEIVDIKIK